MRYRILVPLDGSTSSETVFPFLHLLATFSEVELELLRCYEASILLEAIPDREQRTQLLQYLRDAQVRVDGLKTQIHIGCGEPAREILSRSVGADLVVMPLSASYNQGRRRLLSGVGQSVARSVRKPLLLLATPAIEKRKPPTIMVTVVDSVFARARFEIARDLAIALQASLILYHPVLMTMSNLERESEARQGDTAQECLERLARECPDGLVTETRVRSTTSFDDIVGCVHEVEADLLVLGSLARGDSEPLPTGNATEDCCACALQSRCGFLELS